MKKIIACISIICYTLLCYSQNQTTDNNYRTQKNISYLHPGEKDSYKLERCKLDLHYPTDKKGFATLIWFHGGGLEAGEKHFPKEFLEQGYAVIAVNYRLSPRAQNPAYTEDAAEAVAWTFENIEEFGGDKDKIYIAGHSAGGYLCLMLNLDKSYLAKWNIDANSLAGAFPISGQTTTHYTIRKERGLPSDTPIIDKYAPSNNVRKDASPMILITGDKELEMLARYEENAHLYALLKAPRPSRSHAWATALRTAPNPVAARKATPHIRHGSAASSAVAMTCAISAPLVTRCCGARAGHIGIRPNSGRARSSPPISSSSCSAPTIPRTPTGTRHCTGPRRRSW